MEIPEVGKKAGVGHDERVWLAKAFKNAYLGDGAGDLASCRIARHNDLPRVNAELVEGLGHDPAVDLEAVAEGDRERVLGGQAIIHREDGHVLFL